MAHITPNKYRPLYATIYLILFLSLATLVKLKAPLIASFDTAVQKLLLPITNPTMTDFVDKLTFLGGPEMSLIYCLLLCLIVYLLHDVYNAIWALLTVVGCNLINWIVKNVVARPRPSDRLVEIGGYSFPSGHTFGTALFVLLVFVLFLPHLHNQGIKTLLHVLGVLWIIVIALTRIYLHVHYPTDTIASVLLVGFLFECSLMLSEAYLKRHPELQHNA